MSEPLDRIAKFLNDKTLACTLVFGVKAKDGNGYDLFTASLTKEAKEIFRAEFKKRIERKLTNSIVEYDPESYDSDTVAYLAISNIPHANIIIDGQGTVLTEFSTSFINKIKFAIYRFENDKKERLSIFRAYPRTKFLSKGFKFKFFFDDNILRFSDKAMIVADPIIDCIAFEDKVLIFNRYPFEKIFSYKSVYSEHGKQVFTYFETNCPYNVAKLDEIKVYCDKDIRRMRTLSNILTTGKFQRLGLDKIELVNVTHKVGAVIDRSTNTVTFPHPRQFLHFYNDDNLISQITDDAFVADKKHKP